MVTLCSLARNSVSPLLTMARRRLRQTSCHGVLVRIVRIEYSPGVISSTLHGAPLRIGPPPFENAFEAMTTSVPLATTSSRAEQVNGAPFGGGEPITPHSRL